MLRLGYCKCALGIVTIDTFTITFTPHPSVICVPRSQPLLPYGKAILRKCPSFPVHWTLVPSYVPRLQVASLVYVLLAGPEEAQGLQRFWPLHHLAFKFLNLTCHVKCSLHELLCILLIMSCNVLLVYHELCKPHTILIILY